MTTITSHKDLDALTMTVVATLDADVARVWQIWEDPRQLERWWGPPEWPATFVTHSLEPGASTHYYMTGPDGSRARGWWRFTAIGAPGRLELDDGFADDNGNPVEDMGTARMAATLEDLGGRTRMTIASTFESEEHMQKMLDMGME